MNALRQILRVLLPLVVLAAGAGFVMAMVVSKEEPEKKPRGEKGTIVATRALETSEQRIYVRAKGTVAPAQSVVVVPEVSGKVVWQSPELVPGGRFKKGQPVLRINAADYRLAVKQQQANIDRARMELKLERARGEIAKDEWQIIGEDQRATDLGRQLALRKPQLAAAEASLEAAESAAATARLSLSRTSVRAPFNAMVQSENVDPGQVVAPGSQLVTLVGTDKAWVRVAVPVESLKYVRIPGVNAKPGEGSKALIHQDIGGDRVEREGRVIRLLGDLDPVGRMARVLVEIDDPFGSKEPEAGDAASKERGEGVALPLLIGSFVKVQLDAGSLRDVLEVPRVAVRDGDRVFVFGPDERLQIRKLEVAWRRDESVLVRGGVKPGDEVIVSRVPAPVEGMLLRKADRSEAAGESEKAPKKVLGQR